MIVRCDFCGSDDIEIETWNDNNLYCSLCGETTMFVEEQVVMFQGKELLIELEEE